MNQFVVNENRTLTHDQVVHGVMGISLEQLIAAIQENRDGKFDCLFKQQPPKEAGQ